MVAKPLCSLYKNIIKPLDRARYPELRYCLNLLAACDDSFRHKGEEKMCLYKNT